RSEGRGQLQPARTGLGAEAHVHRTRADDCSPQGTTRDGKVHGPVHARRSRRATGLRGGGSQPLNGQAASQGTRRALRASPASDGVVRRRPVATGFLTPQWTGPLARIRSPRPVTASVDMTFA